MLSLSRAVALMIRAAACGWVVGRLRDSIQSTRSRREPLSGPYSKNGGCGVVDKRRLQVGSGGKLSGLSSRTLPSDKNT
jgi:hypothetical protein